MWHTIVGLLMVALTALGFYLIARRRYKCPHCGRQVRWEDVSCPHCGEDMKLRHRAGPEMARSAFTPPRRSRSDRGSR
jgi:DNA-directed RNA polymerase subunit RPC12/RpoP